MVNGSESETIIVISGVPQGSVLGSLLFLIYVNDFCAITLSTGSKVTMYADDLVLHNVVDAERAFIGLQKDIDNIVQWSRSSSINPNIKLCFSLTNVMQCHQCSLRTSKLNKFIHTNISA